MCNKVCIVCDSTCHNVIFMYLCKCIGSRAPFLRVVGKLHWQLWDVPEVSTVIYGNTNEKSYEWIAVPLSAEMFK